MPTWSLDFQVLPWSSVASNVGALSPTFTPTATFLSSARAADPALQQFARLIDNHEAETLEFVSQAKWLESEELFYLGFHFAEKEHAEKKFGGEMLRLVAQRSPRSKLAKDAKTKLRGEGLD